jgi:hypothetical protein
MVTGEREQRAAAMMDGEVGQKTFLLRVERMLWRAILRQREGVRGPLNRIADAAKMRREPVFGLSVSKMRSGALFWEQTGGEALQNIEG